jgi:hypothetical protein
VAYPLEAYTNKIPYAFVTLQCLRYKNSNGCEWCRTEYCQVKTAGFIVRQRKGVWGKKTSQDSKRTDPEFGLHLAEDISASHL